MSTKVDEVVAAFLTLRDKKSLMEEEHKKKIAVLDEKMDKLRKWLLDKSSKEGVDSFKTSAGTAYRVTKDRVSVADKDSFINFVVENELFAMLPASANKVPVKEYLEENGELPPGLDYQSFYDINVRRS